MDGTRAALAPAPRLPGPERPDPDRSDPHHQLRPDHGGLLGPRAPAAPTRPPLRGDRPFPGASRLLRRRARAHARGTAAAPADAAPRRSAPRDLPSDRPPPTRDPQRLVPGGRSDGPERRDLQHRFLQGGRAHGLGPVLRLDLSQRDDARVLRLPRLAPLAGGLRPVPHRARGVVVRPLEALRDPPTLRGRPGNAFASDPLPREAPATGAGDVRAVPLAAEVPRGQVPGAQEVRRGREEQRLDDGPRAEDRWPPRAGRDRDPRPPPG